MAAFEQLNDQLLFSKLKIKFDPLLGRSWRKNDDLAVQYKDILGQSNAKFQPIKS